MMVHLELDSFYVKFKNLLRAEKDATLTLKSEAGRAFVTLSVDLGHVLSEQDLLPRGSRNGPARVRRREKRAAAREKLATEEATKKVESTENVEETRTIAKPVAEEANGNVKSIENVDKPREGEELAITEQVEITKGTAENATELGDEVTAEKVELEDEFCTDDVYNCEAKETKSVESETLETRSKLSFDYYSLRYDDLSDCD